MPRAPMETHRLSLNGIRLQVMQTGPADGPVAMLLHGFPETWRAWEEQIDALVAAGYRVWLPLLRGYAGSDKPSGPDAYRLDIAAGDIEALIEACGRDRVVLMGHDWGGIVAWWLAQRIPQKLQRIVIVNAPHFEVMSRHLRRNLRQMLRSLYALFFQLPSVPEYLLSRRRCRLLLASLRKTSRPGAFSVATLESYVEAWMQPQALTGMLNWYRAKARRTLPQPQHRRIAVPTLLLWGVDDRALGRELAQPSLDYCDRGTLVFVEDAGHWVLHEAPQRVNRYIADFLA